MSGAQELARLWRALLSLEGLATGDAFGKFFFSFSSQRYNPYLTGRVLPEIETGSWSYTNATQMTLSLVETLRRSHAIDQEQLSASLLAHYEAERDYNIGGRAPQAKQSPNDTSTENKSDQNATGMADDSQQKARINAQGKSQRQSQRKASIKRSAGASARHEPVSDPDAFGNGAAIRAAPLGAYFASDPRRVIAQARLSATVTYPEAIAGTIAVAVAAALAWQYRATQQRPACAEFIEHVLRFVPASTMSNRLRIASEIAPNTSTLAVASMLGSGPPISAQDSIPFVLWCAGQFLDDYEEALWQTASGLGAVNTTCAMVGGIVVLYAGVESIPTAWLERREPLPSWVLH